MHFRKRKIVIVNSIEKQILEKSLHKCFTLNNENLSGKIFNNESKQIA